MPRKFVEFYKKKVTERMQSVEQGVISGSPQSFEDYRERVGKLKAYRLVLGDLDTELQKYIEEDDE